MLTNRLSSVLIRTSQRLVFNISSVRFQSSTSEPKDVSNFTTLSVTVPKPFVYHVELNRPEKINSMTHEMWLEIKECFDSLDVNEECRVIIISGKGNNFTSGLDFSAMSNLVNKIGQHEDIARRCKAINEYIFQYQKTMSSLELCAKPVIGLINGFCIGAGVDLISSADMRYCTEDAVFQVKEVDIGMAADVGTLQRLPRIVGGTSLAYELCYTGRKLNASEAKECGLVNRVYKDKESLIAGGIEIAQIIALKSPVAVQVTKRSLIYSRDHSVQEGLDHIGWINQSMLQSEDFAKATMAIATRSPPPQFDNL